MSNWAHTSPSGRNLNLVNSVHSQLTVMFHSLPHLFFFFNLGFHIMSIEYTCEEQQQFWEVESGLWLLFMLMSTDIHVFPAGLQLLANAAHSVSSLHQPPSGPWKSLFFSLFSSELICLRPIRDVSRKYFSSPISKICGDRYRSLEWWYCQSLYCSQIPILSGIIFFWDKVWGVGLSEAQGFFS